MPHRHLRPEFHIVGASKGGLKCTEIPCARWYLILLLARRLSVRLLVVLPPLTPLHSSCEHVVSVVGCSDASLRGNNTASALTLKSICIACKPSRSRHTLYQRIAIIRFPYLPAGRYDVNSYKKRGTRAFKDFFVRRA